MSDSKKSFFGRFYNQNDDDNPKEEEQSPPSLPDQKVQTKTSPSKKIDTNQKTDEEIKEDNLQETYEGQLTVDVFQTTHDIIIKSTIAGVKPGEIDVTLDNDMLTIKGERKKDTETPKENYFYQECYWGPFSRSIILPTEVDSNKISAELKNGILTISLPKTDDGSSKKIAIEAK